MHRYAYEKQEYFTTSEVSEITGLTHRQLQWWDEKNILTAWDDPRGGPRRCYSTEKVAAALVLANLRRRGLPVSKMRRVSDLMSGSIVRRKILLTDGRTVKFTDSSTEAFEFAKSSNSLLMVDLPEVTLGLGRLPARQVL